MNKKQWKSQYHEYRKGMFNFKVRMETNNYPCGHDDMLYENHAHATEVWLENKPVLRKVLTIIDETDMISYRQWLLEDLDHDWRLKELIQQRR